MGSFSPTHWVILLLVVILVFGTKKLRSAGKDLGGAVKGFKDAVNESETKQVKHDSIESTATETVKQKESV